jgi:hypothetical protein
VSDVSNPIRFAEAVVLDQDFTSPCRALWVSVAGAISVRMYGPRTNNPATNVDVVFPAVPVGWFAVQATRVNTTGTVGTVSHAGY